MLSRKSPSPEKVVSALPDVSYRPTVKSQLDELSLAVPATTILPSVCSATACHRLLLVPSEAAATPSPLKDVSSPPLTLKRMIVLAWAPGGPELSPATTILSSDWMTTARAVSL